MRTATKNLENCPQIEGKSLKIDARSLSGDLLGQLWSLEAARSSNSVYFCRSKSLGRSTQVNSG